MALPTTVVSKADHAGYHPPFKSSGGNFYVVAKASGDTGIGVYKSTDPTSSLTEQNTAGNPARAVDSVSAVVSCVKEGDNIHIATITTALQLEYHKFSMSSDTWSVTDDNIADLTGMSTPGSNILWCSIAYRSGAANELVVAASGVPDPDMSSRYERVDFWHIDIAGPPSTAWTGPVSIYAATKANSEIQPVLVLGTNDKIHVSWSNSSDSQPAATNVSSAARTIQTDNSLSSTVSAGQNTNDALLGRGNGLSYDDGGTQRILWPYKNASDEGFVLKANEDGSDNVGTLSVAQFSDGTTNDVFENGEVAILTTVNDGSTTHIIWSGGGAAGVDQDLYHDSSTDGGATWGTDVEELNAVTVNFISATVYTRSGSTVIAYLYDDGGTTKYNEITLSAGATSLIYKPMPLKAMIGR